jgi:hypothetical protein
MEIAAGIEDRSMYEIQYSLYDSLAINVSVSAYLILNLAWIPYH